MKWECIGIRSAYKYKFVAVWPSGKIDIQWLAQKYPGAKIERDKYFEGIPLNEDWLILKTPKECSLAYTALIGQLGSEGWEPFDLQGMSLFFQRSY